MTMLAIVTILVGAVLGLRFKFLILLPITGVFVAAIVAEAVARSDSAGHVALAAVLVMVGLQVGYLAGVATRCLMVLARTPSRETVRQHPARSLPESTL